MLTRKSLLGPKGPRRCHLEQFEARNLLAADLHIGAVYFEAGGGVDTAGDMIEVTYVGGAEGTELTELIIDTDKIGNGLDGGDPFLDVSTGALGDEGVYGSVPFKIESSDGFSVDSVEYLDGGTTIRILCSGFQAGMKLELSADFDEYGFPGGGGTNAVVEGGEFHGSHLRATFEAPHYFTAYADATFEDEFDLNDSLALPNDAYIPQSPNMPPDAQPGEVYTAGGEDTTTQELKPITISGIVFEDTNMNLIFESSTDTRLEDVWVTLLKKNESSGLYESTGMTTQTEADGSYEFDGLTPGTYRVEETQPTGYVSVGAIPGTVDGEEHGIAPDGDTITEIELEGGEDSIRNDFAEVRPASLSGHVFHDLNNNGEMDPGEPGIEHVRIQVDFTDTSGLGLVQIPRFTFTTGSDGAWSVDNLLPGRYTVFESQPLEYVDGKDDIGSEGGVVDHPNDTMSMIDLGPNVDGTDYDFGEIQLVCISGRVFVDPDENLLYDASIDTAIPDVTIQLYDDAGTLLDEMLTGADGTYKFCPLEPGTYSVVEIHPDGYIDSEDRIGTQGGNHSGTDSIIDITLPSGNSGEFYDFTEKLPASIAGRVFGDVNDSKTIDDDDTPLEDVVIYLLDENGARIAQTTTNKFGAYIFKNLTPGTYGVEEIQPDDWFDSKDFIGKVNGTHEGQFDGNDKIIKVELGSSDAGVNYDFLEFEPASISGYVFQDGEAIWHESDDPRPEPHTVRDGLRTSDDTPISGVTLRLTNHLGLPIEDAAGNPMTTVTDANGYYEFTGLEPGPYVVWQTHPEEYTDSIDTPGSKGGAAVNAHTRALLDPTILTQLGQDPNDDAILSIDLEAGEHARNYNFSEVQYTEGPPPPPPPPEKPPGSTEKFSASPMPMPVPVPQLDFPIQVQPPISGGGGMVEHVWHLSVINAGDPRSTDSPDYAGELPATANFDPNVWQAVDMQAGQWSVAGLDGVQIAQYQFGSIDSLPIVGDFDGDGIDQLAVYIDGHWVIDLNGDGQVDEEDLWALLGKSGDRPVVGDWDGDGKDDIGVYGPVWPGDEIALANEPGLPDAQNATRDQEKNVPPDRDAAAAQIRLLKHGAVGRVRGDVIDHVLRYNGTAIEFPVSGDFNGDGVTTVGVFRDGRWQLDVDGDGMRSDADLDFLFGKEGDLPVVGDFDGNGIDQMGVFRGGQWIVDSNGNFEIDAHDAVFSFGEEGDVPMAGDFNGDGVDEVVVYRMNRAG